MKGYLLKKGIDAAVISPNSIPGFLDWLPMADNIVNGSDQETRAKGLLAEAGLIFCLDFNSLGRVQHLEEALGQSAATKVLIDHHLEPGSFDWMMSDTGASSTGELVYVFINGMGDGDHIDARIGTNLFVAIITDTGSFQHSSTSAQAHRVVADLIARGVNTQDVIHHIYQDFSEGRIRFFGHCTLNKMSVDHKLLTAWITVSKDDMRNYKVNKGDLEGLVNIPLQMRGIAFSALLQERDTEVKLSLRSTGTVDVNRVAREHFNGGGHRNAAGGSLTCSLEEAERTFKTLLPSIIENSKHVTT
jgi:phosphoesterase RecJ-like protein